VADNILHISKYDNTPPFSCQRVGVRCFREMEYGMRRKIMQFALALLALTITLVVSADAVEVNPVIRVGLSYGDSALPFANLENSVDSGYYLGYFNDNFDFVILGNTDETKISVLKTQNIFLQNGSYCDSQPSGESALVGCYHIQLPGSYASFDEAKAAAGAFSNAFPAWISGCYYVRVSSYATKESAQAALGNLGIEGTTIVGTSSYAVSVLQTKTTNILFQYDGGQALPFAIKPGRSGSLKPVTWFKGYRYYGGFRYERISGGDLTVVNIVSLEDYVKGVVPYEMSASWPTEALKVQAVCARTYAMISLDKHRRYNFDVCNTTDCQVYRGLNSANDVTNQAVDETRGMYAMYNGALAQTYYFSSDGGGTEDVRNVWSSTSNLPYLAGVIDPYEAAVVNKIPNYSWTFSFTKSELAAKLQSKGYICADIVDFRASAYSPTGNVLTITFADANGKEWSFSKDSVRTLLGLRSIRYTISGGGKYYVDGVEDTITAVIGAYAIDGSGSIAQVAGTAGPYVITSAGTEALTSTGNTFTINGTGWGHNVGMSQWGAFAMATMGYTYDEILKFYFTGIDIY